LEESKVHQALQCQKKKKKKKKKRSWDTDIYLACQEFSVICGTQPCLQEPTSGAVMTEMNCVDIPCFS
jgi:hypothetical protein